MSHDLSQYNCEIAKIIDTFLGFQDHGILTGSLTVDFGDGGGQSIGGYAIKGHGGEYLSRTLQACGVDEWGRLKGRTIFVLRPQGKKHEVLGIAPLPTEPGVPFLFDEVFSRTGTAA